MVWVLWDGVQIEVFIEVLILGDIVIVCLGECIVVDGVVVEGVFYVYESMIIGEFVLVEKLVGVQVIGGMVNGLGSFNYVVICVGVDIILL